MNLFCFFFPPTKRERKTPPTLHTSCKKRTNQPTNFFCRKSAILQTHGAVDNFSNIMKNIQKWCCIFDKYIQNKFVQNGRFRRNDKKTKRRKRTAFTHSLGISKIERGQRNASREQVIKLADFFKVKEDDLLVFWLSDKLVYEVADEEIALKALKVAEEKVKYIKNQNKWF